MALLALLTGGLALAMVLEPASRSAVAVSLLERVPVWALLHMTGGAVALAAGALQLSDRLRRRRIALHRTLGTAYVVAVSAAGVAALPLAATTPAGLPAQLGFGLLGVGWLWTTWAGFWQIRLGRVAAHRRWMARSYALSFAAVMLRIYMPLAAIAGFDPDVAYGAVAWLCWVPNLVVVEGWRKGGDGGRA